MVLPHLGQERSGSESILNLRHLRRKRAPQPLHVVFRGWIVLMDRVLKPRNHVRGPGNIAFCCESGEVVPESDEEILVSCPERYIDLGVVDFLKLAVERIGTQLRGL